MKPSCAPAFYFEDMFQDKFDVTGKSMPYAKNNLSSHTLQSVPLKRRNTIRPVTSRNACRYLIP